MVVKIMWETSSTTDITCVYQRDGGDYVTISIPSYKLHYPDAVRARDRLLVSSDPDKVVDIYDVVSWHECPSHMRSLPLVLEPGLSSFAWPLDEESFISNVYQRKAFVVHSSSTRLSSIKEDMFDFDITSLINDSSHCVVWMKNRVTKAMQYIDAAPDVALSSYMAGQFTFMSISCLFLVYFLSISF
jgi:hypothetical protein